MQRKRVPKKRPPMKVYLKPDVRGKVDRIAAKHGLSASAWTRMLVTNEIEALAAR